VPKSIPIGLGLYVVSVVAALRDGGTFFLILGTPILLYQGILLYQIYKRQNWARIALLVFVMFLIGRLLPAYGYLFGIGPQPSIQPSLWEILDPVLRVAAVACLFSRTASHWFVGASLKPLEQRDLNGAPESRRVELSNFGLGSASSIGTGILVTSVVIGAFYMFSHELHRDIQRETDAKELKPGDANYPVESANPAHVIPFVVSRMELSNYKVNAEYGTDVKLCGHQIALGGYFPYGLSIPIEMVSTEGGKYRGSIIVDKFQPGKCGWKFLAVGYARPDGVGNAVGVFRQRSDSVPATPHIDMWCYRVTDGEPRSSDPKCEILAMLRWPDAERRVSAEFLAKFSHEQLDAKGAVDIATGTQEITVEFHDLNAIPGALTPVGDRASQIKATEEARAIIEASPEGQARQCFERANLAYGRTRPPPDTATDHSQRDAVLALKNKCRADFALLPLNPEP
jgi:hypothetical protein